MQTLAKLIYFKILGWKLVGSFPQLDKCVVIVVPHTSWVDFLLGLLIRRVLNEDIHFIGKKALFKPPFGWYFRWMGGTPIDRKKVAKWRTGFYYIAKTAKVPIVMVAFDFGKKQIKISKPHYPTENKGEDFATYKAFFKGVVGKVPENSF